MRMRRKTIWKEVGDNIYIDKRSQHERFKAIKKFLRRAENVLNKGE